MKDNDVNEESTSNKKQPYGASSRSRGRQEAVEDNASHRLSVLYVEREGGDDDDNAAGGGDSGEEFRVDDMNDEPTDDDDDDFYVYGERRSRKKPRLTKKPAASNPHSGPLMHQPTPHAPSTTRPPYLSTAPSHNPDPLSDFQILFGTSGYYNSAAAQQRAALQ